MFTIVRLPTQRDISYVYMSKFMSALEILVIGFASNSVPGKHWGLGFFSRSKNIHVGIKIHNYPF